MTLTLNDKQDIQELLSRAAFGYDERDTDMLTECFADDAEFSMRIADGDLIAPFTGRDGIMTLMTDSMAEQTDVRRHVISNVFFAEPEQEQPVVVSNLTLLATENGVSQLLSAGVYRDRVQRSDGQWRIVNRHLELDKAY